MKEKEKKYCGNCCWFCFENTDGWGNCVMGNSTEGMVDFEEYYGFVTMCGGKACSKYVSRQQMRHYQAVLLQANRYRRDKNVPAIYKMPDPKELGRAIDFAVEYMKIFGKL